MKSTRSPLSNKIDSLRKRNNNPIHVLHRLRAARRCHPPAWPHCACAPPHSASTASSSSSSSSRAPGSRSIRRCGSLFFRETSLKEARNRAEPSRGERSGEEGWRGRGGGCCSPCCCYTGRASCFLARHGALLIPTARREELSHSSRRRAPDPIGMIRGPTMSAREKGALTKDSVSLLPCFYFVEVIGYFLFSLIIVLLRIVKLSGSDSGSSVDEIQCHTSATYFSYVDQSGCYTVAD